MRPMTAAISDRITRRGRGRSRPDAAEGTDRDGNAAETSTESWWSDVTLIDVDNLIGMGVDTGGVLAELPKVGAVPLQESVKVRLVRQCAKLMTRLPSVLLCKAVPT